jgi:hypothetical protein
MDARLSRPFRASGFERSGSRSLLALVPKPQFRAQTTSRYHDVSEPEINKGRKWRPLKDWRFSEGLERERWTSVEQGYDLVGDIHDCADPHAYRWSGEALLSAGHPVSVAA